MKVNTYDRAYERSYTNAIGPGPAAYSHLYRTNSTDRFKETAFSKSMRKLTQGAIGPGPQHYEVAKQKDKQALIAQPRVMFNLAQRKIRVTDWGKNIKQ